MVWLRSAFICLLIVGAAPALGAPPARSCKAIADQAARLTCFEQSVEVAVQSQQAIRDITVQELLSGFEELQGARVTISGYVIIHGGSAVLQAHRDSRGGVFIAIERLPHPQRRMMYDMCNGGCFLKLTGSVGPVMLNTGIIPDEARLLQ
jgi:hypothetical protein